MPNPLGQTDPFSDGFIRSLRTQREAALDEVARLVGQLNQTNKTHETLNKALASANERIELLEEAINRIDGGLLDDIEKHGLDACLAQSVPQDRTRQFTRDKDGNITGELHEAREAVLGMTTPIGLHAEKGS